MSDSSKSDREQAAMGAPTSAESWLRMARAFEDMLRDNVEARLLYAPVIQFIYDLSQSRWSRVLWASQSMLTLHIQATGARPRPIDEPVLIINPTDEGLITIEFIDGATRDKEVVQPADLQRRCEPLLHRLMARAP